MSSPAVLCSVFSSLPPRPPTPPREARHDASAPIRHPLGSIDSRASLHTPPGLQSPASSATTSSTSGRIRKKVGFSAQAEYKDPPLYAEGEAVKLNPTPVSLPPSTSKPVKSILKVTNHIPNLFDSTAGHLCDLSDPNVNLTAMLESTIQQLAGGDRDSKVDAYLTLARAWKASNNLPDRVALQEKMSLFTQFMQRDIVARTPEGALDTSLVNHALNLLNTFLHFPAIASTITNDFGVFIIDHCIRSFEDPSTPKDTARRLMQVISLQNFSPKVLTLDRVGRLVASLHNVEEHLKGKSIVLSRVLIYRKLVKQSKQLMVIHSDWLFDMFTDMLSTVRDIRSSAVSLGLEAAFTIGHEKQLSRKVMELFNLSYEDGRYIQYYEEKLKAMSKDKHESAIVPDIWSVVILLLRVRLDKWEYAGPWLQIIQNCFNSGDFQTKIAANRAWARLVYLLHVEEWLFGKSLSMLTTPLISQLRRKGAGKTSEELRQAVLGGICNLFYYAFKPNTNSTLLDAYWDSSVKPVVAQLVDPKAEAADDNLRHASAILRGLFDCTTPRIWRVDRIVETAPVMAEELPAIDSRWLRRNSSRVFAVVEPILEREFLALSRTGTATYNLWKALLSTVASAAAKEIKVSRDTALFVSDALGALQKIWRRGPLGNEKAEPRVVDFLLAVRGYLAVMISSLGLLPFTEKAGKQGPAKAPLYSLFSMLSTLSPGVADDKDFAEFFASVFAPFFSGKGDKARMDLAQDLLSTIPMDAPRPYGPWLLVAENVMIWLEPGHNSHHSTVSGNETPVGHDYRDIVKVLERGIRSTPHLPRNRWESVFHALVERVRDETGDAGVAIVVIEPLAKVLLEQFTPQGPADLPPSCVGCVTELVSVATQPRDKQAVDAARKRLWGTVLAGSRSTSYDTFDNLYKVVNEALAYSYNNFSQAGSDSTVHLLKELGAFLDRCNRQLFLRAMVALQDGFLPWFQDCNRLLGSQTSSVLAATKSLWDKLTHLIADIEYPEQQLQSLERFFCASFASCHKSIVNSSVSLWNRLFENIENLDYPEQLKAALVQMQLHADIVLPGLDTSSAEHAGQQPFFVDSLDDFSLPRLPPLRSSIRRGTPQPTSSQSKSPASVKLAVSSKRHIQSSPEKKPAAANWRSTTPRLRHDDSQVHFATIEPSFTLGGPIDSQVLTERQKEVRERQKDNAALFPEIRSSPGAESKRSGRQMHNRESPFSMGSRTRQAATPEPEEVFNAYVSSTPTPRRGQAIVMPEHDMTDPPSSPPEPRGNPLAAEIKSRSASHSLLEEWQFSSSPISGSPTSNRHGVVPDPLNQRGYVSVVSLPEVEDDLPQLPNNAVVGGDKAESQLAAEEIIEDSLVLERPGATSVLESSQSPTGDCPSTPHQLSRLSQSQIQETPTPKSEGEVYVDAPTSPLPPTPNRAARGVMASDVPTSKQPQVIQADNTSFDISDVDEKSLLRLVVELDSGKLDRSEYRRPSASPDKGDISPPTLDCIVVDDSPQKAEPRMSSRRTRASSATSVGSPIAESDKATSSKPRGGRKKRKRAPSKARETSSQKRQRHESIEEVGEVPDSQTALVQENAEEGTREKQMPCSSAELLSVESPVEESKSQDTRLSEKKDAMEVERHDQTVQAQVVMESLNKDQCQEKENDKAASPEAVIAEQEMQVDSHPPVASSVGDKDNLPDSPAEPVRDVEKPVAPELNEEEEIMSLFQSGLDKLRTARLSRQAVYKIEDMFMDMKRELYEAERRGRA
ncbi:hypothetical protein VTK56DRAFT_870 [Thermocarpiscus australiensis]